MNDRQELYKLIEQARIERERQDRMVDIVGNVLFGSLAVLVVGVIVRWSMI